MPNAITPFLRRCESFIWTFSRAACFISSSAKDSGGRSDHKEVWGNWLIPLGIAIGAGYIGSKTKEARIFPVVEASTRRSNFNFISDVAEKNLKAVVSIEMIQMARKDYFSPPMEQRSSGSGFIIREDGLILTNAHVVMGRTTSTVTVKLSDGTTFIGVVEDVDVKGDFATVRIKSPKPLPVVQLGNSADIRPGEWVVAIGSPLTFSNTVTFGVVSSVQRKSSELKILGKETDYIQTDVAVTYGNSGGPLVNLDGQVIGINSMSVTSGISFAIPIDYAKVFLKRSDDIRNGISPKALENPGRYMGITMLSLKPSIIAVMRARNIPIPADITAGVLVWKVVIGSPAHVAGLMPGDIVHEINGERVIGAATIYQALDNSPMLMMKGYRGITKMTFNVMPEKSK